jgi:hypothetical protein
LEAIDAFQNAIAPNKKAARRSVPPKFESSATSDSKSTAATSS